jgi:CheY-like chemotaxis protein
MAAARLLIIESNPGALIVARNILARAGYDVITSTDPQEGIERARIHDPHVVLLDGAMADRKTLLDLSWLSDRPLPLLLLVPKGLGARLLESLEIDDLAHRLRMVEIVEKPFLAGRLLRAVEKCFKLPATQVLMEGRLGLISVDQIIQFAENVPATVCCRIRGSTHTIEIFLRGHHIFHARGKEGPVEELIFEVMSWTDGSFQIIADPLVPEEGERAGVALAVAPVLMEGMTRLDEWRHTSDVARGVC